MTTVHRRFGPFLLMLALSFFFPRNVRAAEDEKKASQPHIVLIGISDYADKQIKPRAKAEEDVKALYDLLTSKDYLGANKDNVRLLLGHEDEKRGSKPATRANILEAVHWLATDAKRDDLAIFVFIGQGCSLGDRGDRTCYFASDSTLKERAKSAVAAADLAQEFDKVKSHSVAVFIDINFKGFDAGKESIPEATLGDAPFKEFIGDDGTEEHNPLPGRVIYLATTGLAESPDLKDHGMFAKVVLDGLKGEADKDGYEPDGHVTVDELTTYLNKQLPELKRKEGVTSDDRRRDHFVVGGRSAHFALTTNPTAAAKAKERLIKFDDVARKLNKDEADQGRKLLEAMPRLKALRDLRKEYQNYADGVLNLEQFHEKRSAILAAMKLNQSDAMAFADKVMEAVKIVDEEYVKEVNQGDLVAGGIRGLYRWIDEKVPEDIAERLAKVKDLRASDLGLLLRDARLQLGKREDLDQHKDIDIVLQRALIRLDPYTFYYDPEIVKKFEADWKGQFTGIGVQIRKDNATGYLQVISPIKGSPSHRKGLQAGDLITTVLRDVDSQGVKLPQTEVLNTKEMELGEAVKKILGQAGTKVTIRVQREGTKEPFDVEIVRARIELESVFGVKRLADDSWDYWLDKDAKLAYIRLSNFALNSADDLQRTVKSLKRQGMKGLVLDLRFNPGGLLRGAQQISDLFIDDGPIVSIRRPRLNEDNRIEGVSAGSELDFPLVCLVNGQSASASEIVSACLQDHKRAIIMGERSYGKGSVQHIKDFDGGQLKFTVATFWRPSGKNLNKSSTGGKEDEEWGVKPDKGFDIELSRKERDDLFEHLRNSEIIAAKDKPAKKPETEFKDKQLDAALKYLQDKARASR